MKRKFRFSFDKDDKEIEVENYPPWMIVAVVSVVFISMTLMFVFR